MSIVKQFSKFASVGAVATVAQYITLILFQEVIVLNVVLAASLGYGVGALVNYWLNFHWTFANKADHKQAAPRFFTIAVIGLCLNASIVFVLADQLGLWYLLAQMIATGLVLIFNFVCNRLWTFKEQS